MTQFDELAFENVMLHLQMDKSDKSVQKYIEKLYKILDAYVAYSKEINQVAIDILSDSYHNKYQIRPEYYSKICDLYEKFNTQVDWEQVRFKE